MPKFRFANHLAAPILDLLRDRRGNVAVMFAVMMVPCIYLLGMTLDYTQAIRKRSQLNAALDAAVIAAVTPSMLNQSAANATTIATNVFNATATGLPGLSGQPALNLSVTNVGLVRTVTGSYTAASTNNFPILLGTPSWSINGTSSASASGAPNINFYLLLDDSSSMAIAANQTDINTLMAATKNNQDAPNGCGFACHETNVSPVSPTNGTASPASKIAGKGGGEFLNIVDSKGKLLLDSNGNPYDNYALARSLNLTLRIDLVAQAVTSLMSTAQTMQTQNNNTYQAAIYTFDTGLNTIYAPSGLPSTNLSAAGTQAATIQVPVVWQNNWRTSTNNDNDTGTNFSAALQSLNTIMPNPGGGTSNAGDTPQEVVFLVTDGVEDKAVSSRSACSQTTVGMPSAGQYRCQQPFDTTWCTTVKNRGIRIAVLYTEYLALPTDTWYMSYNGAAPGAAVASFNSPTPSTGLIATNLQACASPGLFYDVETGGDITKALNNLFQLVIASAAHLTQ